MLPRTIRWFLVLSLWPMVLRAEPETSKVEDAAKVTSPDQTIQFLIHNGAGLGYSVRVQGQPVLAYSRLGLEIEGDSPLGDQLRVVSVDQRVIDETWQPVTGAFRQTRNHANEITVHLQEVRATAPRRLDLVVRAYDDGVAFRYVLPKHGDVDSAAITAERTAFEFSGDYACWSADYEHFNTSQEKTFTAGNLSGIKENALVGMPLLVRVRPDLYFALTEADLTHWAGVRICKSSTKSVLAGVGRSIPILGMRLAQKDRQGPPVKVSLPAQSPWRVVMIARHPGDLIGSSLVENLNPPSEIKDTSWIKPGLASWDWWSGRSRMETESIKKFIQLSADMGWPFMLLDAGWYHHNDQPDADLLRVVDTIDMPELLRFAKEKNVRLWLWMAWRDVLKNDAYKKAFPLFRDWGIAGVKIDYMNREDQWMVDFYHTMFQATADNRLMLDFHGAYKPTGARRTWPNYVTQEGVLGNEYSKGSREATARHNVTIPYTRMLLGPMDYTPGGFLNQTPAAFQPHGSGTTVPNTRGQELAKFVVFESPFLCACDYPDNYRDQPGADFLKLTKASWDDVRFLGGEVGESILLARQSGADWFIGGMTNEDARRVEVPLNFLPPDTKYTATIWRDAPDADQHPEKLVRETREVAAADKLPVEMSPAGGFVVHLTPR